MGLDKSSYKGGDKLASRLYAKVQIDEGIQISDESNCAILPSAQLSE